MRGNLLGGEIVDRDHGDDGRLHGLELIGLGVVDQPAPPGLRDVMHMRLPQPIEKLFLECRVVGGRDQTARIGKAPQKRCEFEAMFGRAVDKTAGADIGAAKPVEDFDAAKQSEPIGEVGDGRQRFGKRAGLMGNSADRDSHVVHLSRKLFNPEPTATV